MAYDRNQNSAPKTVYFRASTNGERDLIPLQVNPDGSLKYCGRYHYETLNYSSSVEEPDQ